MVERFHKALASNVHCNITYDEMLSIYESLYRQCVEGDVKGIVRDVTNRSFDGAWEEWRIEVFSKAIFDAFDVIESPQQRRRWKRSELFLSVHDGCR